MTPRLQKAIEDAYGAFEGHRLGNWLEVCHCPVCMTKEMAESILKTPLRELSNEQLGEYTNSSHEWSDQFLALLPRYMELIAGGERPTTISPDHILSRFKFAPENCMSHSETAAFDEWLPALFEDALGDPIPSAELDRALTCLEYLSWNGFGCDVCEVIMIALPTPFNTSRFRTLWSSRETRDANLRLAAAIAFGIGADDFNSRRFLPGRARDEAAPWCDWFTFADHRDKLTKAFDRATDPRAQQILLAAL